ncbi:gamma-carboxymuconolactone decarboxylase [Kocuria coralli]|uniref:Gamma-carboxymuconolactone decarboxylase n=1 Tax=Kocuria coralli TaxID=1461025 RepID=A0A5J5L064_9MICC|nr:carboxymuconolactone decarboxylase family protein [Kocuria coralli]KAA9395213.1 gamma-carboxymuconolactone decarboxylase [Kocuria coralli]
MNQDRTRAETLAEGMRVRREVLSDAHVDRAEGAKNDFTEDWQDFISRYAWGEIWTRPGLDRPMRSAITLTALIAGGHWGEFEMHVGAALRNGLTREQIKEILLQSAIYLSVPAANNAFSHARRVFDALDDAETADARDDNSTQES